MKGTVHIVDDDQDFLESVAFWIEGLDYETVTYEDPRQFVAALPELGPRQCCVLDVRMPIMSGLEVQGEILKYHKNLPVIFLTAHGDVPLAVEAMRKGAVTMLQKPLREDALASALEQSFGRKRPADAIAYEELVGKLTARETQILNLLLRGKMNKTIAADLCISIKTVEMHRANLMKKMGARCLPHLMAMATRGKLIEWT
jgi:two-component system response regulator FixJ